MKKELQKLIAGIHVLFAFALIGTAQADAQILTNGSFEGGGSGTGFYVHDYTLINPLTGTSAPGQYARTTNPALMNTTYNAGGDHTTGTGNMLVLDGATLNNRFFWTTGNTGGAIGGFTAGTTYTFSFWIKSVSNAVTADESTRASIGVFFVNANNINPANLSFLAPMPSEGWVKKEYSFVATADNVMVRLKTNSAPAIGGDFAVDDFSITVGGLPFVGSYTSTNPTCPNSNDGSIIVSLTGGTLPYTSYSLTGTVTQTNTNGIFTGLDEGIYNITVSDSDGQQYTQTGIILAAPNDLQLSPPVAICPGDAATLTATGGTGVYNWTASPADSSLNATGASQTVHPSVTTTYTVTSGSTSSQVNLIQNGNFSQGMAQFATGYTAVANPNPFGVQSSFYIVTNPNAWFTAFSSCGDHTTGSGNLMVFDGATIDNVIAWSNINPVAVTPNTNYTFSYYVASVAADNPARLEVLINGVSLGLPVTAPATTCQWTQVSYTWNSGANTTANFVIYDRNIIDYGNDFALDDITFNEALTCQYQKTVTVTVSAGTLPTFSPVAPICSGQALSTLPTTSNNGITGTWSPALNNTATTTYTFTPNAGQCALPANLTITVNQGTIPTFAAVAPICSGQTLTALPTTSTNGITGAWSPALNNTATTTYTFTPATGQCAVPANLTITVNQPVTPTFTPVAAICSGESLSALPATSNNGITGSWSPALNNTSTTTYTFTPNTGQCAANTTLTITVNPNSVVPVFDAVAAICAGETLSPLPTTSNNNITGSWSPALNNAATTTYTFTPDAGQCAVTTTLTITVSPNSIVPAFDAIAPICTGATLSALPTTSNNNITGSWSPALNNTVTTTYTFTPDAGQCAVTTTLTITVNPNSIVPAFDPVGPICSGEALAALPTTSNNGITGAWSPALSNTATTTYTFTPAAGQCALNTTLTITVTQPIVPTFASVAAICSGEALSPLPTTSSNGIMGTWSPALNNTATTTYTFTPAAGQCAATATLTINVTQPVEPTFAAVSAICKGDALAALPTTSSNGFIGTWSPALDNMSTTTYTFSPVPGQCAAETTLTITVNTPPDFSISEGCAGTSYRLNAEQDNDSNSTYAWFNASGTKIGSASSVAISDPGTYKLVLTQDGCSSEESITVLTASCGDIQRGISPNNDGLNDYFDLEAYNVKELKIFNRYGMNVYTKANYQNEWYGQGDNGDELPDGTYFYVIDFADAGSKTGWIYSNRER